MGAFDGLRGDQIAHGCEFIEGGDGSTCLHSRYSRSFLGTPSPSSPSTSTPLFCLPQTVFPLFSACRSSSFASDPSQASLTAPDWGPHTGTIDWCETNYTHTPYIAEFVNTLTNIPVIILGLYGAAVSFLNGVNRRYVLCYLGLSLIGVGSTGFHASLRWEWQLMDELPMIYVVSWSSYLCFDTLPSFKFRFGLFGPALVLAWCVFVTFSYLYLPNPIYHQIAFATLLISAVARNVSLLRSLPQGHPGRLLVTRTLSLGVLIFAGGFAVWNVDNVFCSRLRDAREYIGWPGFLLEGHGLWHIMTGYGSFLISTAAIYMQLAIKVSPDAYTFDSNAFFPTVYPVMPSNPPEKIVDDGDGSRKEKNPGY